MCLLLCPKELLVSLLFVRAASRRCESVAAPVQGIISMPWGEISLYLACACLALLGAAQVVGASLNAAVPCYGGGLLT